MLTRLIPLREWRESHGYTLQEIADLTGLSEATISRVERGERTLRPASKVMVARRLGVRVSEIFEPEPVELAGTDDAA